MKNLIILRGNSGSGKTTIAKELQKKFGNNTMVISQDVIRRDMLKVKDGENCPAITLMKELLLYGSKHSSVVILEGILVSNWYKSLFELAVKIYGENINACYFDLPFEETLNRHLSRSKCNEFGEEEMKRWWLEKDFSELLNEVIITEEKNIESIVEEILLNVQKCS